MMLTLRHRPQRFADLAGQDSVRAVLQALAFSGDMPPALLFSGASGTGKTTAARLLAKALNCADPTNGDCCNHCRTCRIITDGAATFVHEIDAATNGGVDNIRHLKALAQFATDGAWRVIMLDEAHAMSASAFNALLKVLEEPPPATVFVLLTTEPDKIMETVRTRTMPIIFRPVPAPTIHARLQTICADEHLTIDPDTLREISLLADGGVRDAVMLLDQAVRVGVRTVDDLRRLTGHSTEPAKVIAALVRGDYPAAREHLETFFTTSGDLADLITTMIADLQERFANHTLSPQRMVGATRLLWDARTINTSPARIARNHADALITLLYGVLADPPATPVKPAAEPPIRRVKSPKSPESPEERRLDLDELADLLSSE